MEWPFGDLKRGHYGAILADPPWAYWTYSGRLGIPGRTRNQSYGVMNWDELASLPVEHVSAENAVLFCWVTWPKLKECIRTIEAWGFTYKSCAFDWTKADTSQMDMFRDDADVQIGMGYWTRANTEPCLLATRGKPKRLHADVRQGIIAPRREHSRKPDGIHERIERLVAGPFCELFARQRRPGWDCWGNETSKFEAVA